MNTEFDRLRDIFLAALEQPPDVRDAYLDQACSGDAELRRSLAQMLHAHAAGEGPLDRPALAAGPTGIYQDVETAGTHIGPYKLLE